ncbi:GNAT family N-acetyltransferase [Qaidamihabitans albus]|uniref:GNAT family N-acetyltransferase n=1 Tax=Qaidamihabitans albus TaxID=2795733 RepID=UPI0018F1E07E|nr:GNAT family N-acetyltransferase [Qaidamihabitans albus]
MDVTLHTDVGAFAELARPFYAADPVRHTGALTALRDIERAGGATALISADDRDGLGAVLSWHAPFPAVVSGVPAEAAPVVAGALASSHSHLGGVTGPRREAEAFAREWCALTGATVSGEHSNRLYELGELAEPVGVRGEPRLATAADTGLLTRWRQAFTREALPLAPPEADPAGAVARVIDGGETYGLWCVDGEPVAMALARKPQCGMSRIGYVYTPPELRGHGYAAAVTAAASRRLREAGVRHVVLFADTTNPVSNRVYRRLGYRPILETAELALRPAGEASVPWTV